MKYKALPGLCSVQLKSCTFYTTEEEEEEEVAPPQLVLEAQTEKPVQKEEEEEGRSCGVKGITIESLSCHLH